MNEFTLLGGQCPKCFKQKVNCICDSKFKVGDWVVDDEGTLLQVDKIRDNELAVKGFDLYMDSINFRHWQPKPNEWCWFWDYGTNLKTPIFGKFVRKQEGLYLVEESYEGDDMCLHEECEPFIGELPSWLKETK